VVKEYYNEKKHALTHAHKHALTLSQSINFLKVHHSA